MPTHGQRPHHRRRPHRPNPAHDTPGPDPDTWDDDQGGDPADLLAIQADDRLLDMLGRGGPAGAPDVHLGTTAHSNPDEHDDTLLIAMLSALRADVDSEPHPQLISLDDACAAVTAAHRTRPHTHRLMSVAAAVTLLALCGVAVLATHARPGEPLWNLSALIDPGRATSIQAAQQVDVTLAAAQQALAQGRDSDATRLISQVQPQLTRIRDTDGRDQLARRTTDLLHEAEQAPADHPIHSDDHATTSDQHSQPDSSHPDGDTDRPSRPEDPHQRPGPAGADPARQRADTPGQDPRDQHDGRRPLHDQAGDPPEQHLGLDQRSQPTQTRPDQHNLDQRDPQHPGHDSDRQPTHSGPDHGQPDHQAQHDRSGEAGHAHSGRG